MAMVDVERGGKGLPGTGRGREGSSWIRQGAESTFPGIQSDGRAIEDRYVPGGYGMGCTEPSRHWEGPLKTVMTMLIVGRGGKGFLSTEKVREGPPKIVMTIADAGNVGKGVPNNETIKDRNGHGGCGKGQEGQSKLSMVMAEAERDGPFTGLSWDGPSRYWGGLGGTIEDSNVHRGSRMVSEGPSWHKKWVRKGYQRQSWS